MSETFIIVKFDLEGSHNWPGAPSKYAVLRNKHSHIFHFEVQIPVAVSRQIEFLEARRALVEALKRFYGYEREVCKFWSASCEDLANATIDCVGRVYGCGAIVRVFEDAFVGAEVRRLND